MRITKISVRGLFGMFDHEIPLNQESRITIAHGPNGVGKTVLLKMVHGLFHYDYEYIGSVPFEQLRIEDSSGRVLTVMNGLDDHDRVALTLLINYWDKEVGELSPYILVIPKQMYVAQKISEMHPEYAAVYYGGKFFWVSGVAQGKEGKDQTTEDNASLNRTRNVYSKADLLTQNPDIHAELYGKMPDWFKRYFYHTNLFGWLIRREAEANLISTERLIKDMIEREIIDAAIRYYGVSRDELPFVYFPSKGLSVNEVEDYFEMLSNEGAELDHFYLEETLSEIEELEKLLEVDSVKDSVIATEALEAKIEEIAAESDELDLLEQYEHKLEQGQVFCDLLNESLLFKTVELGDEDRFRIINRNRFEVPLTGLSSGEQHLFVLYYQLLFEISANTLVMIDEPELSMNVVWQRNFLKDLHRIIELRKFDVLIATHSPEVIYDKWDWTVALGERADD